VVQFGEQSGFVLRESSFDGNNVGAVVGSKHGAFQVCHFDDISQFLNRLIFGELVESTVRDVLVKFGARNWNYTKG